MPGPLRGLGFRYRPLTLSVARGHMVWYVALIAIVNLGLGYGLAVYLGAGRAKLASVTGDTMDESEYADTGVEA